MTARILVTGANGFIGRAVSAALAAKGHEVARAVRSRSGGEGEMAVGEVGADTDWREALAGSEVIVHLAARAHVMRETAADPLAEFRRVNVEGTLNLARQASALGARRFVFVSSIKVNGECTIGKSFSGTDAAAPVDAYAISKWEAEQGLQAIARETGMDVVRIRPPLVYGPGVKGNFAALLKWARRSVPLPLGAVHNRRSFLALENLADFIALCADLSRSPAAANRLFLISDGEDVSTTELLKRIARAFGRNLPLLPVPEHVLRLAARCLGKSAIADRLLDSLTIDSGEARALGWRPVISMDEQLRKMAQAEPSS